MFRTLLIVAVALLATACQSTTPMSQASADGWAHYGDESVDAGRPVALGTLAGGEDDVVVEATITSVCPKKGCWMRVVEGDEELFVRFKDYGFFVPRNAEGHRVTLHGRAESKVLSVDELRHYAEDAGKSAEAIAAINEPEASITFFADSVYIEGEGLDAPWAPSPTSQPAG